MSNQNQEHASVHWINLVANLGVVLGLVLLAYELNQSNKLAATQAYVLRLDQMQQTASDFAQSDYLGAVYLKIGTDDMFPVAAGDNLDDLTDLERSRLRAWERGVMLRMSGHHYQYLQGYLDQETGEKILRDAESRLERWNALGIEIEGKELREALAVYSKGQ
jgi:hypothetical protein